MTDGGDGAGTPVVTALITNYNYAEFLGDALDSVLAQDYAGDIEIVVVDDGSTDDSAAVLARYGDRVRVLRQPNRGQLLAMRAGLAASGGDVICLLDADDAWAPGKVTAVVEALGAADVAWVAHGLRLCDTTLRPLSVEVAPAGRSGAVPGDPVLFLERRVGTATSALALRAEAARGLVPAIDRLAADHGGDLRYDADRAVIALLGAAGVGGYQLPDPLALYRRHERQQFAAEESRIALLERQIQVDRMVGRILAEAMGAERVPTTVYKHALILAALRGEGGRTRLFFEGLKAAARVAPTAPGVAVRQALAVGYAWLVPGRWLRKAAVREGAAG